MSTGVFETCREMEYMYTKKRIVRQVGYLQEFYDFVAKGE
jgi:hypothetical protein